MEWSGKIIEESNRTEKNAVPELEAEQTCRVLHSNCVGG